MVIQRTIENLRDRPEHERRFVALVTSCCVMGILFFGWVIYFVRHVQGQEFALPTDQVYKVSDQISNAYVESAQYAAGAAAQLNGVEDANDIQEPYSIDISNDTTHF